MNLTRYARQHPLSELKQWLNADWADAFSDQNLINWTPKVDITETDQNFVVHADMPGVHKDDIRIAFENGILTVSGKRESHHEHKEDGKVVHSERSSGEFCRSFSLPKAVDSPKIKAKVNEGILTVTIPKTTESQPRSIVVE